MNLTLKPSYWLSLLSLLSVLSAQAQDWNEFKAQPASSAKIEGTSTIHDWTMEGNIIGGSLKLRKDFQLDANTKPGKVDAEVSVNIPVRSLKSGKSTMDEIMQQAMNEANYKKIEYKLTEFVLKEVPAGGTGPFRFESTGELSIAGKTNKITMPVELVKINPVRLEVRGKQVVKMTDYGVKPPNPNIAGIGIKTGDDITVTFVWKVAMPVKAQ